MSILVRNCDWVVTQNSNREVLRNHSVYIEDGRIHEISPKPVRGADHEVDGTGKILLPGLINAHTHLSMTLFRGYADDLQLQEWLSNKIWPIESKLTPEACYQGALLGCLEMISSGTTSFVDMYFYMEEVARATQLAGLRGFLSVGMIDMFDKARAEKEREKVERFSKFVKDLADPRIAFVVGPHAPYTCSDETLLWAKEKAEKENAILHTHIAETRQEQAQFQKEKGMRVVDYLKKIGFLSPKLLAAHCVWLTKSEVELLAESHGKVAHCPVSNMKLATGGMAPVPEMLESRVPVGLGTDGAASNNSLDMFDTMKFCALAHKAYRWDPTTLPAQKVLDLATIDGAKALGAENEIGSIETGKRADMILLDARTANLSPLHGRDTVISDLVYAAKGHNTDTTIVDGKVLMENRKVTTLDYNAVLSKTQAVAEELVRART